MRMQGKGVKDPLFSFMHPRRTPVMALTSTSNPSRIWFFCANRVLKMNFYYFGLCSSSENICDSEDWKTLKIAGFKDGVDAILMPQDASDHEYTAMYAFSGDMYASINPNGGSCVSFSVNRTTDDDYPVTGYVNYTSKIIDGSSSLKMTLATRHSNPSVLWMNSVRFTRVKVRSKNNVRLSRSRTGVFT